MKKLDTVNWRQTFRKWFIIIFLLVITGSNLYFIIKRMHFEKNDIKVDCKEITFIKPKGLKGDESKLYSYNTENTKCTITVDEIYKGKSDNFEQWFQDMTIHSQKAKQISINNNNYLFNEYSGIQNIYYQSYHGIKVKDYYYIIKYYSEGVPKNDAEKKKYEFCHESLDKLLNSIEIK